MKLNWGFGIAVVYILFAGGMIAFAVKAFQQKNDLVSDTYYEDAVNYQQRINAGKNADMMDSKLYIAYVQEKNSIEISSAGKLKNLTGSLSFYKPDQADDDFKLNFALDINGSQIIPLKKLSHGYWKVNVTWTAENKNCYTENRIFIQ